MFSKRFQIIVALLSLAGFLSGCTLKTNEPEIKPVVLSINPVEAGCLSNIDEIFDRYFAGKISATELNSFWDCLHASFSLFLENTTGRDRDLYTPKELVLFLDTYFLGAHKVNSNLSREAMVLKQAIIGGSTEAVTRSELRQTLDLMEIFRHESLTLLPYLPFSLERLRQQNLPSDKFDRTATAFHDALEHIGEALNRSVGPYEFDSLKNLIDELNKFLYGDKANDTWAASIRDYLDVIRTAKSVLISPPAKTIGKSDWRALFRLVPRYYTLYLRIQLAFHEPKVFLFGEELKHVYRLAMLSHEYLAESIRQHPNEIISEVEIRNLVRALDALKLLPLQASTVENFLPVLVNKFFRDLDRPVSVPQNGITMPVLDRLWNNFVTWSEGQFYIEGLYRSILGDDKFLTGDLTKEDILSVPAEEGLKWTQLQNEVSLAAILEIRKNVADIRAFFPKDSKQVLVPLNRGEAHHTLASLGVMSLLRTGSRMLIQGYAADPNRAKLGKYVTQREIAEIYQDIFPIAHDLGLLDNPNPLSIGNRITEADLFLPSADGDSNLSQDESTELLAVALSALSSGNLIQQKIAHECLDLGGTSFDEKVPPRPVPASCYFKELENHMGAYWTHVPGLVKFFDSLKDNRVDPNSLSKLKPKQEFLHAIDDVVRKVDDSDSRPVLSEDSVGYVLISYYMEYLFDRYDLNNSGTLSKDEAWRAYPVFRNFIAARAGKFGLNTEKDYKALFHYLLKYQNLPNESVYDTVRYFWTRYFYSTDYETDRLAVARLFSRLLKL